MTISITVARGLKPTVEDAQQRRRVAISRPGRAPMFGTLIYWPIPAENRDWRRLRDRSLQGRRSGGRKAKVQVHDGQHTVSVSTDHVFILDAELTSLMLAHPDAHLQYPSRTVNGLTPTFTIVDEIDQLGGTP